MDNYSKMSFEFPAVKSKKVVVNFGGGEITSDAGLLLIKEIDKRLGLTKRASKLIPDPRCQNRITHQLLTLLKQRVYGIALGYEDVNDHDELRKDPLFQTATETDKPFGSSPTLCRFEKYANRETAVKINELLVDQFIESHTSPPQELVLDFDATDDPIHGHQEGRFYHGYYKNYCFLPLYVFCGTQLLVSYLRPSNQDAAKHSWAILSLLVKKLRAKWPNVKIMFRGDSGFSRHKMFSWCERNNVDFIVGIARNDVLERKGKYWINKAENLYTETNEKQKHFGEFNYAAGTWKKRERRIIIKAEYNHLGKNTRFVVTSLTGDSEYLYSKIYCARGNMERYIDEQLTFYSDRTSCQKWWANQFRLLLSSLAYVLVDSLKRICLNGLDWYNSRCVTIRLKLLKIGAVVQRNTRRIQVSLSEGYPHKNLFWLIHKRLCSG